MPQLVDLSARLRERLLAADYTYDAVARRLGATAHAALGRNETTPGLRATRGGDALDTLVRLWLLQAPVPLTRAEEALGDLVDPLCAAGVLHRSVSEVAARLDVRPYATDDRDLWVASDLTPGLDGGPQRVGRDHVLGISSASTSLAQLTMREPVDRALDLGTGCGVQALHLAGHAGSVVATDVNERALRLTRFNLGLNAVEGVEVREGSFFEPVQGEEFDLIATNPPFVISPATGERLVYRDSGLPGDAAVELVVRRGVEHLAPGGWLQVLANWVVRADQPWDERLAGWLDPAYDALVVQREVLDPASYVELWLKDSGHHGAPDYAERYDTWLSWLEEQGVGAIGFGWIDVRRSERAPGAARHELVEWPYDVEQPIGPAVRDWGRAVESLHGLSDEALLATHPVLRPDVRQESHGVPGEADPETIVLRSQRGLRRARTADTIEAGMVGACDGELSLGQILDALAVLLEEDPAVLRTAYLPVMRELVGEGFVDLRP